MSTDSLNPITDDILNEVMRRVRPYGHADTSLLHDIEVALRAYDQILQRERPSEISVVDADALRAVKLQFKDNHDIGHMWVEAYERARKPVLVSLEKLRRPCLDAMYPSTTHKSLFGHDKYAADSVIKAVLDAAGVDYVD